VHVDYLASALSSHVDLTVHCWGKERAPGEAPRVHAHEPWADLNRTTPESGALRTLSVDVHMAAAIDEADLVHSHTWYANLGGHLAKLLYDVPHVATVHSLEPMRPWKAEQLGGGYRVSRWCEETALIAADTIIAVSDQMRRDLLSCYPPVDPARVEVIYNGIDANEYSPSQATDVLERYGIDPGRPIVLFVGRITRQKGVPHLLDAAAHLIPGAQLVLCAGAPDTPAIGRQMGALMDNLRSERGSVTWIEEMLPKNAVVQLMSHATVFVCPSIYEPLGIVNLEAMACATAVVATATGGIPEVVEDGVTGFLVPFEPRNDGSHLPSRPKQFARDIADRVNHLLDDPSRAEAFGNAGRRRAIDHFSWSSIAEQTAALYHRVTRQKAMAGEIVPRHEE
jgi:starch synthase